MVLVLFLVDGVEVDGSDIIMWMFRMMLCICCSMCGMFLFGELFGMGVRGVNVFLLFLVLF